jgi:hypothetical protein
MEFISMLFGLECEAVEVDLPISFDRSAERSGVDAAISETTGI